MINYNSQNEVIVDAYGQPIVIKDNKKHDGQFTYTNVRAYPPIRISNTFDEPIIRFIRPVCYDNYIYSVVYSDINNRYVRYLDDGNPNINVNFNRFIIPTFSISNYLFNPHNSFCSQQPAPFAAFSAHDIKMAKAIQKQLISENSDIVEAENESEQSVAQSDDENNSVDSAVEPSDDIDVFSDKPQLEYDKYAIVNGTMCIKGFAESDDEDKKEVYYEPFTNFCVLPVSIDCMHNVDGSIEKNVRIMVIIDRNVMQEMVIKPNKTEKLLYEIQKIYPQACLEPFVKAANKHLSAYLSKLLSKTPECHIYRRAGWNDYVGVGDCIDPNTGALYRGNVRKWFYCNDAMQSNLLFSVNTGKMLHCYGNISCFEAFYHAVRMLKLSKDMRKTMPLFLFAHLGVMYRLFEEAGYAPNFLLYVYGRTGSLKTSVSKVFFKIMKDGKNDISSNFNDTATAMEIKMGETCDEVLLIDDFRPSSNKTETSRMRNSLEKVVRFFGDSIGKGRGNPMLTLKKEFKPHAVCAITGEYLYGVPSSLLRMLIVHVDPNTYDKTLLKFYQDNPLLFSTHIRHFVDYLTENFDVLVNYIRTQFPVLRDEYQLYMCEARQVQSAAWLDLMADIIFKHYATERGLVAVQDANRQYDQCKAVVRDVLQASNELASHVEPHDMFMLAMVHQIKSNRIKIASGKKEFNHNCDKSMGFLDREKNILYVRPSQVFTEVQRYWQRMDKAFNFSERMTRQALLVNMYIRSQTDADRELTSNVVRIGNDKEVRMLAFYLDKLEREYGKIEPYTFNNGVVDGKLEV